VPLAVSLHEDMSLESTKPIEGGRRDWRSGFLLRHELLLLALPTAIVSIVLALVDFITKQHLLFASLASSAFAIYVDPNHSSNSVRTLFIAQLGAALLGLASYLAFGPGYLGTGSAMLLTILLMVLLDAIHPPAVSTSLSFAFKGSEASSVLVFGLAVAMTATLVVLQRVAMRLVSKAVRRKTGQT